jgi:hypothetical protein
MPFDRPYLSTGLPGLDRVFQGLRSGDNIVWQVDTIDDYVPFVQPYCANALAKGRRLIYFRFAKHAPLVSTESGAEVHVLHPEIGFESFITEIHDVIERAGHEAFYVFDALSELSLDLISDRMLGNFYMLTCPYLYALRTIAYYALLKNYHSFYAASPIAETTQILIDVYRHKGKLYVHPRKVKHRYSATMHMLHVWEGNEFRPVTESNVIADVLTAAPWSGLNTGLERPGSWSRVFIKAEEMLEAHKRGEVGAKKLKETEDLLIRMAVTRDVRAVELARKYFTLQDILDIRKRMVSSGLIGGKSFGMVLSRAILAKTDSRWENILEPHDSFFIGSEVFYSFLVNNHCWRLRQQQKDPKRFLEGAEEARQRMLMGTFPSLMVDRFANLLDYFGQAPIIVRSSSLLEDNYGNAFAGKYESVFCANQGPRHIRLDDFINAVRTIYASSMSEEALSYRAERGLLDQDEQMALLVQRVSGVQYGTLFLPHAAGVGLSFNPYSWHKEIDPRAGVVRLVFGLGTRAVDRTEDDYTRIVALNAPSRRPEAHWDEVRRHTQRRADVLDLEINQLVTRDFVDVASRCPELPLDVLASRDEEMMRQMEGRGTQNVFPWLLTFDHLLSETPFAKDMREMMQILQDAYGSPVDIEFTLNFRPDGSYKINLLQCRRFQFDGAGPSRPVNVADVPKADIVLEARGAVIGKSRISRLDRVIYIVPSTYSDLTVQEKYETARLIGRVCNLQEERKKSTMLIGPGRWGTSTPALGVPVSFREIRSVSVLGEMVHMRDDLIPDVSLGTHFFSDLIETDIVYVAFFPGREGNAMDREFLEHAPNALTRLMPDAGKWSHVVRVIEADSLGDGISLKMTADNLEQRFCCYRDKRP